MNILLIFLFDYFVSYIFAKKIKNHKNIENKSTEPKCAGMHWFLWLVEQRGIQNLAKYLRWSF